jgi:hypothetical protein
VRRKLKWRERERSGEDEPLGPAVLERTSFENWCSSESISRSMRAVGSSQDQLARRRQPRESAETRDVPPWRTSWPSEMVRSAPALSVSHVPEYATVTTESTGSLCTACGPKIGHHQFGVPESCEAEL